MRFSETVEEERDLLEQCVRERDALAIYAIIVRGDFTEGGLFYSITNTHSHKPVPLRHSILYISMSKSKSLFISAQ